MIKPNSSLSLSSLDAVLGTVERPGRYSGGERNIVKKDLSSVLLKFALCFPDTYEIGMSHLGLRILYDILNGRELTAAERVFMPWKDFGDRLRSLNLPLFSLESRLPLSEFDVVGFSLQHELCYTNVLEMLELGGVPIRSKDRSESAPLVIGGGPCTFNPEPMWEFFDFFVVGDGERAIVELAKMFEDVKRGDGGRREMISRAREIEGVYIPSDYEMAYSRGLATSLTHRGEKYGNPFGAPKVKRAIIEDLQEGECSQRWVVPSASVIHDRAVVEIMRGCSRGCRFCQAGFVNRPARERDAKDVVKQAEKLVAETGYEEISFLSLSSGDHSGIEQIIGDSARALEESRVSISLPSLRSETLTQAIVCGIKNVKRTGLTLAPEAGSDRLRRVINKPTTDTVLMNSLKQAFAAGWRRVKLYFMIGLPTETDEDIEAIIKLVSKLSGVARQAGGRGAKLTVSVSTFIPKPHTPFQWCEQLSQDEAQRKFSRLNKGITSRNVEFRWHSPKMSFLEGALSRGDRSLSVVIERAFRLGCILDNWSEEFDYERWMAAFDECGLSPQSYLNARDTSGFLPWEQIDCGLSRDFLLGERERSESGELTLDCRRSGECTGCGVCEDASSYLASASFAAAAASGKLEGGASERVGMPLSRRTAVSPRQIVFPLRCRFERVGPAKYVSHLDALTALGRAIRQSLLPIEYTKGFNPQPRLSAGMPLPIGYASLAEYVDFKVQKPVSPHELVSSLNPYLMEGIRFTVASHLVQRSPSLCALVSEMDYSAVLDLNLLAEILDDKDLTDLSSECFHRDRIEHFLARESIIIEKTTPKKTTKLDLRALLGSMSLTECRDGRASIRMILKVDRNGRTAKPDMVLSELYNITDDVMYFADITRLEQYCWRGGKRRSLQEIGTRAGLSTQR